MQYRLSVDDLKVVHQTLLGSQPPPNLAALVLSYVVILPLVPFGLLMIEGRFLQPPVLGGYVILVCLSLALVTTIWLSVRRHFVKWSSQPETRRYLQRTTLSLRPDGVHVVTPLSEARLAWPLFADVNLNSNGKYVFMQLEPTRVIVIPDHAFDDAHAMHSFVEEANNLRLQGQARGACRICGYDLRGAPDAGCPECGWMREDQGAAEARSPTD